MNPASGWRFTAHPDKEQAGTVPEDQDETLQVQVPRCRNSLTHNLKAAEAYKGRSIPTGNTC